MRMPCSCDETCERHRNSAPPGSVRPPALLPGALMPFEKGGLKSIHCDTERGNRGDLHHRSCALHELRAGGLRSGRIREERRLSHGAYLGEPTCRRDTWCCGRYLNARVGSTSSPKRIRPTFLTPCHLMLEMAFSRGVVGCVPAANRRATFTSCERWTSVAKRPWRPSAQLQL